MIKTPSRPIYVFRVGQLGDALVALPAIGAIKRAVGSAPLVLISDRVPGEEFVPSWDVFQLSGLFSQALSYTPMNRSFFSSTAGLVSIVREVRRLGRGPLFYLINNGGPISMIRRHRIFFERLCGLEMIGLHQAPKLYMRRDQNGHLVSCPPEYQRLHGIVQNHFRNSDPIKTHDLLPHNALAKKAIDKYWNKMLAGQVAVAVGPGSKMPCKKWPTERFAEAGRFIIEKGMFPVIFGGRQDREIGNVLLRHWNEIGLNLCGMSIAESAEALRRCAFYVGNDTGTMHLAATVGLKCVAIFSARDAPGRWDPVGKGHIILRRWVPCEGCMLTVCKHETPECLDKITVEDVIGGVERTIRDVQSALPVSVADALASYENSPRSSIL